MTFAFDTTVTMGVIVTVLLAIIGWVQMGRKSVNDRIRSVAHDARTLGQEHGARLDRHDKRLTSVEQVVVGLPGKDDIHDLRIALEGLRGDMKEVRAAQTASAEVSRRQEVVVQRVEQYLLERSGK